MQKIKSLVMNKPAKKVEGARASLAQPVPLGERQLRQVVGGSPKGGWSAVELMSSPKGGW